MNGMSSVGERPPRDRAATRQRLLDAARRLFAEHGYDHVTVRMIAAAAGANVALINRYFGSKSALFAEVLAGEPTVRTMIDGDDAGLSRRLAEHVVRQIHTGAESPVLRALDRSVGSAELKPMLRERMENAMVRPLATRLAGPDARVRALLAASVLMGSGTLRRILGHDDLRTTDRELLTARLTAIFEACLADPPVSPP
jgi:AcrR family transcriptional regulator